jgi:hypothetical protein
MELLISDIEHARKLETSMNDIGTNKDIFILRSALIHFYTKKNYIEDLIRLIADPSLIDPHHYQYILSALIDSNRIKETEDFVARLDDVVKGRWEIRLQLARLEVNARRFDSSLAISQNLLLEKKDDPGASGLFMLSLVRLHRYIDLFEYIESASDAALSPDWAVLALAHDFKLSSCLDTSRMLRAIERISLSRAKEYRLWSVRLKRIAGFVNEALQELKASDPTELLKVDYKNELEQILSLTAQYPSGDPVEIVKTVLPLQQLVQHLKKDEMPPESMSVEQIEEIITKSNPGPQRCIVISVGHDDYKKNSGGVQFCIQIEEQLATQKGWCYLNVHPWQPLPILASEREDSDPLVSLILNGQLLGVCYSSILTRCIKKLNTGIGFSVYPVIHSLMGHSLNQVKEWAKLNKNERCWLWLHDFFTLCPSYTLQRNKVSFCNAPAVSSNACNICNYGDERVSHLERMKVLFQSVSVTVISPSEITKDFWLSKVDNLECEVKVLPHMEFSWFSRKQNHVTVSERPISIGFLGVKSHHKGWYIFEQLVNALSNDSRFQFFYFGTYKAFVRGVHNLNVNVSATDPFAMIDAVSKNEIDFVLHWPTGPETFSFTAHEAIASGAHILTNPISGNVAAVVRQTRRGTILSDVGELLSFFSEGKAEKVTTTIRSLNDMFGCKPRFSEMTIPFLIKEHSL